MASAPPILTSELMRTIEAFYDYVGNTGLGLFKWKY
jgi:hypothetical protein